MIVNDVTLLLQQDNITAAELLVKDSSLSVEELLTLCSHFIAYGQKVGSLSLCDKYYAVAVEKAPDNHELKLDFADYLYDHERFLEAKSLYCDLLDAFPNNLALLFKLGLVFTNIKFIAEAITCFESIVASRPDHKSAWLQLTGLYQDVGDRKNQQRCVDASTRIDRTDPNVKFAEASLLFEQGNIDQAIKLHNDIVKQVPSYLPSHNAVARLRWEYFGDKGYLEDTRIIALNHIDDVGLQKTYLRLLSEASQWSAVIDHVAYLRKKGLIPQAIPQEAMALDRLGDINSARRCYQQCVYLDPADFEIRAAYCALLLRTGEYTNANEQIGYALNDNPYSQLCWSYQGLVWRLQGDDREHWLHGYDTLIQPIDLVRPDGFNSIDQFLKQLAEELQQRHRAKNAPQNQTLRGGTQTQGDLFLSKEGLLPLFKQQIDVAVKEYLSGLGFEANHPFISRFGGDFFYSGSWSVLLQPSGYHHNHIHASGWLSSACYLELPDTVSRKDKQEGWIQFGQPPSELGIELAPRRLIQPKLGRLVLFPSYTWHGTTPFSGNTPRMTAAFDVGV